MTETNNDPLVIVRQFDAPLEKVWAAWSEPEPMMRWWGPKDYTAPVVRIDFRVGGKYLVCMHGQPAPDAPARDTWSTGTYREIVPLQKIIMTDSFADADGQVVSAETYGLSGFPLELEVTVAFKKIEGRTMMTLQHVGLPAGPVREQTEASWNQSFDKLAASLE